MKQAMNSASTQVEAQSKASIEQSKTCIRLAVIRARHAQMAHGAQVDQGIHKVGARCVGCAWGGTRLHRTCIHRADTHACIRPVYTRLGCIGPLCTRSVCKHAEGHVYRAKSEARVLHRADKQSRGEQGIVQGGGEHTKSCILQQRVE